MKADGAAEPILLGGAAVEIYTQGGIVSRDFDLAVPDQKRLENELEKLGFIRTGQFDATPYGDQERLTQAIYLYTGARGLDRLYLDRRIREEAHGRTLEWFIKEVERRIQADSEQEREP